MAKKKRKYTPDVLAVGALAFVGSVGFQRILLQPKTEVDIKGIKVPVQGILPFSQKHVANIGRKALNDVLPVTMSAAITVMEKIHVREQFKKGVLWFVYEFMSRYSINSILNFFFKRFKKGDRSEYRNVLRDYVQKMITEKADRETIIRNATEEVMKIMQLVTDGTIASVIFNERFAEAASAAISAAINRFLADDAANRVTEYILKFISQLEDVTLPGFLENTLGFGRAEMANFIDAAYDAVFGQTTVQTVRDLRAGDIVADMVNSVDYEKSYDYVSETSLLRISAGGAFAAMSFYAASKRAARRFFKFRDGVNNAAAGLASLFSNNEFDGEYFDEDEEEEVSD